MIAPLKPQELKIEITDACNLQCTFCYLGEKVRHGTRFMPEEDVLRWIDWTVDNGIPAVRFTGGEATLHPQLEMFCCYAHLRGLYVVVNTNGMASPRLYEKLFTIIDDVRVSVPILDAGRMDEITGNKNVLARKIDVIDMALKARLSRVCILTILLPELKGTLEGFVRLAETAPNLFWMPLRYESTPAFPRPWSPRDAQDFAQEMAGLIDRFPDKAQGIFLATPFCGVTPTCLGARVFHGRTEDCGPFAALNINACGQMQACFDVCELGGVRPLGEIGECIEIRECTSKEALPEECGKCVHVPRCAGGCRKPYGLVQHNGRWVDYLAGFL